VYARTDEVIVVGPHLYHSLIRMGRPVWRCEIIRIYTERFTPVVVQVIARKWSSQHACILSGCEVSGNTRCWWRYGSQHAVFINRWLNT